jgi:hypothetical protein
MSLEPKDEASGLAVASPLSSRDEQNQEDGQDYADGALRAWSTVVGAFLLQFYAVGVVRIPSSYARSSGGLLDTGHRVRSLPGFLHNYMVNKIHSIGYQLDWWRAILLPARMCTCCWQAL